MTPALVLGALLAAACVVLVALPYLRDPDPAEDVLDGPGELERRQLELAEVRDRALAALKELELDHRTGKVSDEDYRALVGPLRREAASALAALELRAAELRAGSTSRVPTGRVAIGGAGRTGVMEPLGPQPPEIPEPYPPPGELDPPQPPQPPETPSPYPAPGAPEPPQLPPQQPL